MEVIQNPQDVDWDTKTLVDDELNVDSMGPMELEEHLTALVLYCAFCKWGNEEAGPLKRKYIFSRADSLGRHVRVQHLENRAAGEGFDCPYRGCSAFLGSADHFLNHTQRQHGLRLWYVICCIINRSRETGLNISPSYRYPGLPGIILI
jgi:hypothetical protein